MFLRAFVCSVNLPLAPVSGRLKGSGVPLRYHLVDSEEKEVNPRALGAANFLKLFIAVYIYTHVHIDTQTNICAPMMCV